MGRKMEKDEVQSASHVSVMLCVYKHKLSGG